MRGSWLGPALVAATLAWVAAAQAAPPFWRRLGAAAVAEVELGAALNRASEGYADERDLLRVRSALVELGRGQAPRDPAQLVLLVHFRIELSYLGAARGQGLGARPVSWLQLALAQGDLPPELRALAHFELGRLLRAEGQKGAAEPLAAALSSVLDDERAAQISFLLGLERFQRAFGSAEELARAESSFVSASERSPRARVRAASLLGLALLALARGREGDAALALRAAHAVRREASEQSGISLGVALSLRPFEERYFEALFERAARLELASSAPGTDDAAAELRACAGVPVAESPGELAAEPALAAFHPVRAWLEHFCRPPQLRAKG